MTATFTSTLDLFEAISSPIITTITPNDADPENFAAIWREYLAESIVTVILVVIAIISLLVAYLNKTGASRLVTFSRMLILVVILGEEIFALYFRDDSQSAQKLFFIFFGFAAVTRLIDVIILCVFNQRSFKLMITLLISFRIVVEFVLCVLFMWISTWTFFSIYTFSAMFVIQFLLECTIMISERRKENAESAEMENADRSEEWKRTKRKVPMVIISGLATLPYVYFNADSYFATLGFGIFSTVFIWFAVFWGDVMIEADKYVTGGYVIAARVAYVVYFLCLLAVIGVSIAHLANGYDQDSEYALFEIGWIIFLIMLTLCCSAVYLKSNDLKLEPKKQKRGTAQLQMV